LAFRAWCVFPAWRDKMDAIVFNVQKVQYRFELLEAAATDDAELQLTYSWPLFFRAGMRVIFPSATAIVAESAYTQSMPFVLKVVPLKAGVEAGAIGVIEIDDIARVMRYLCISAGYKAMFTSHVNQYEISNPGTLEQVAQYLAELDALDSFAAEQGTDENLFLEKAGSLQWSKGGKAMSSQSRRRELVQRMSDVLGAGQYISGSSVGSTVVMKGFR